jgi:lantibiotic modifying enzyme
MQIDREHEPHYSQYLERARVTTYTAAEQLLESAESDASLCHGIAGLSESLLICSQILSDQRYRVQSDDITSRLLNRYASTHDWPCGVPGRRRDPSFMLGTAGIAHHLVRLASPAIPSILLLRT